MTHPTLAELLEFDRQHLWHPYSSLVNPPPVFAVKSASGTTIQLEDGREVVDAMASWWSVIHGYNHPRLTAALHKQVDALAHVMFGGLTHRPAVELGSKLIEIAPPGLEHLFFSDSGSVAVEVAIKQSLQYWHAQGASRKRKLLTVCGGYHGDTFGAMAVCDPVNGMHGLFTDVLTKHVFADKPAIGFREQWDESAFENIEQTLENNREEIAAVIIEPIVQGAGGMSFYHTEYLRKLRRLCDEHDTLLIFDEIATGFGRTGKLFACEQAAVSPDIMCLGKALTGGYMSLAATLCTHKIAHTISSNEPGVFMHGPTFMANPMACAVALESVNLLLESPWKSAVATIEATLKKGLERCREMPAVKDVRVLGAIGVVELRSPLDMHRVSEMFVQRGVWLRPFGKLVYVMPPYVITTQELQKVIAAIIDVVADPPLLN